MEEYLIGDQGAEKILTSLSQTTQPIQFIDEFQRDYGLSRTHLNSVQPALKLLDLHQIGRTSLHQQLLQRLSEDLLSRINTLSTNELETLLDSSFPYIGFEELKSIPMMAMKQMNEVPFRFLKKLSETRDLYEQCPIEVKRQIWIINDQLFRDKLYPLILQYIGDPSFSFELNEMLVESPPAPSKRREHNAALVEILTIIGTSQILYNNAISYIRKLYGDRNYSNVALCTLRADLLMLAHDRGISTLYDQDGIHSVAWCLDACMRDNTLDVRRVRELQGHLSQLQSGSIEIGDAAMVFNNPFASHCIVRSLMLQLNDVVKRKQIPKDDELIKYIAFLLTFAGKSQKMIHRQKYKLPHAKKQLLAMFYPIMASQILDDMTRDRKKELLKQQMPDSTSQKSSTIEDDANKDQVMEEGEVEAVDANLESLFNKHPLVKKVIYMYCIKRVCDKDPISVSKYLSFVAHQATLNPSLLVGETSFIQSLITQVIAAKDSKITTVVIDEFLVHSKQIPFVLKQLIRYISEAHNRINQKDLVSFVGLLFTIDQQNPPTYINNTKTIDELIGLVKTLIDKTNPRLTDKTCPILFDYLKWISQYTQPTNIQQPSEPSPTNSSEIDVGTDILSPPPQQSSQNNNNNQSLSNNNSNQTVSPNDDLNVMDE